MILDFQILCSFFAIATHVSSMFAIRALYYFYDQNLETMSICYQASTLRTSLPLNFDVDSYTNYSRLYFSMTSYHKNFFTAILFRSIKCLTKQIISSKKGRLIFCE